ncbi:MAG TPA: 50S ribosomal protein L9 [Pseudomonadales bacterium]|jgi:large subunit ribosomal protein L9|nr:50S ribosomal protein L9 [Gammaproteobacteria bacterium]MDP6025598.1 50S ribosomal protein L9 [Pseudomonadales bacterium]MDP6317456.1 50S ribosomal protein L9 [Pseudomonadales bacterium]MDP7314361.1 50S ribosomal protein L9 [Pseudomonadales bacterium]MDP7577244.1 50S ribosomal protein L9 [Pseudomonadales bacterium]|tara:strand:+ start:200 stop:649 length:450 start_codon:yes stop_codon:yes gene_type:complete
MQVILLENIGNLGELGEKVNVKSGYGRNFLIPQHKAVPATEDNVRVFEERRIELQRVADDKLNEAKALAEQISALDITLTMKAGEEGKLFGSITVRDIAEAAESKGVTIQKGEIKMPAGPIRELGEFEIDIHLHPDVTTVLKVGVIAEE